MEKIVNPNVVEDWEDVARILARMTLVKIAQSNIISK